MSSHSIVSLPPQLKMTPRSIPLLQKHEENEPNKNASSGSRSVLHKLSETSFPISPDSPVNVRIFLHAAKQMSSTRPRKGQPRGYPPPSNAMLFDDDPGIMSEVETSSTGFRRGGKQRSSLPVVRTPSKTLERPLGLVFLQYRNETKRALLPNEITSIDTVKALFVRSFPKQLTMEYLDSPNVKIYIHDSSKDMFYELEDLSLFAER
ncbi:hypothetical protein GEV33_006911 [Tenebrio molitor]|uniref:Actin interacting protein 3-like C-terminal domain-containing protein n=1 Tax=Tenebrio molitor TaxID=7067 RepID=A0A8J6HKC0_TENMO|nr:hypothetical protein GEV33_006911 [Tenebrio molitor]